MVSEKLKILFEKVKKGLSERLSEIKPEDVAKFATKEAVGAIPVVGQIIKDAFDELSPDEKEVITKELKELSESQFKEISEKVGVSVEYLKDIQKFTFYSFKELRADHEEIKEILTRREINKLTIESLLEKDKTSKGCFFRTEPKWIDFEEGFIVEREEVDELIKKLENKNIQLVVGEPASGKSVILKNIGFKLAKKGHRVYLIELKKWSPDPYFKEAQAQEINDEKTLIIVDDAHLQLSKCEELIRDFRLKDLDTKLIIGARDVKKIKESRTEEFSTEESEFKKLNSTEIHAIDATEDMIYLFLTEKYSVSDKHRIRAVSRGLEECKHDLWYLSWALKAYDKDIDTVDMEKIYSAIANEKIKKINAEDIFLPLSVFYRFEIPIERDFLEEQLEIEKDEINQLIELSEIIETEGIEGNEMLSLIHSSIADLYFRVYQAYPSLGKRIKEKILNQKEEDLQYCLFYKYMSSADPRNAVDVVARLGRWDDFGWRTQEEEEVGAPLIKLIEAAKIQKSIEQGIEREEEIKEIGECMVTIAWLASEEVAQEIVNHINIDTLSSKIEKEEDIHEIGWCVGCIAQADKEVGLKLANRINIDTLSSKIEKEGDIEKIGWCMYHIAWASEEVAQEIVNRQNPKLREEVLKGGVLK